MLAGFLESIVPKRFVLLGQKLQPFSLGHNILLSFFRNGFVTPGVSIGFGDLIFGVWVCCQSWKENEAARQDPEMVRKVSEWGKALGPFDFKEKASMFAQYISLGSGLPEVLPAEGEGRDMGSPFDLRLLIFLIKQLGLKYEEALDFPYGMGRHLMFGFYEMEGGAKVANAEEREQLRQMAADADDEDVLKQCMDALPGSVALEGGTSPQKNAENAKQ